MLLRLDDGYAVRFGEIAHFVLLLSGNARTVSSGTVLGVVVITNCF